MRTANVDFERRNKSRFPINRELRYKLLENDAIVAAGNGETIDISSSGIAFTSDKPVKTEAFIELSISWPVLLDEACPMRLIVFGRVQRSGSRTTVCSVEKYEFRTQARVFRAAPPMRSDCKLQRWAEGYRRELLRPREVNV